MRAASRVRRADKCHGAQTAPWRGARWLAMFGDVVTRRLFRFGILALLLVTGVSCAPPRREPRDSTLRPSPHRAVRNDPRELSAASAVYDRTPNASRGL